MDKTEHKRKKSTKSKHLSFPPKQYHRKAQKYFFVRHNSVHGQYSNQNNEQQKIYKTFFAAKRNQLAE